MPLIILSSVLMLICGVICYTLAQSRQRSCVQWLVLGLAFGPFAVAALFILGKQQKLDDKSA